jgi:NADH:ubiquinone oxidoreductase subunit K
MPDRVVPLPPDGAGKLGTVDGFGFSLMGLTRLDPSGHCFATRWLTVLGLPVLPLNRYYLQPGDTSFTIRGTRSTQLTSYRIVGAADLRAAEILRTLLYCWLVGPAIVVLPLVLLFVNIDAIVDSVPGGVLTLIVVVLAWLVGSVAGLSAVLQVYRKRWAPLREVSTARG